jgi:hypothetical protein
VTSLRIYVAGEGPNDIGDLAKEPVYRPDRRQEGFLQPAIRALRSGDEVHFDGSKITLLAKARFADLRTGLGQRAAAAYRIASAAGADAVVVVHDVDKAATGRATLQEARRSHQLVRQHLLDGFTMASDGSLSTAVGTPCRCIEAWALGDLDAVSTVAALLKKPSLPTPPEELWGKPHDPQSNHPKQVLRRIFGGEAGTQEYCDIAAVADPGAVETNCPLSFAPFAQEIRALVPRS